MKAMFWLRMLAWIKRGVLALERLATAQETLAAAAAPRRVKPKLAEVYNATIEDRNAAWQRQRDAEIYGEELGDGL